MFSSFFSNDNNNINNPSSSGNFGISASINLGSQHPQHGMSMPMPSAPPAYYNAINQPQMPIYPSAPMMMMMPGMQAQQPMYPTMQQPAVVPRQIISHTEQKQGLFNKTVTDRDNYGVQTVTSDDGFGKTTVTTTYPDGTIETRTQDSFKTTTIRQQPNGARTITKQDTWGTDITTIDAQGHQTKTHV